jgi:hypothetical protein
MNKPDLISESSKPFLWFKIIKFFDGDPGMGWKKPRIWVENLWIRDPR